VDPEDGPEERIRSSEVSGKRTALPRVVDRSLFPALPRRGSLTALLPEERVSQEERALLEERCDRGGMFLGSLLVLNDCWSLQAVRQYTSCVLVVSVASAEPSGLAVLTVGYRRTLSDRARRELHEHR
jgi:hypothetical protein